jgi:predicted  nucleic acid-binding Zn-ribbon protein
VNETLQNLVALQKIDQEIREQKSNSQKLEQEVIEMEKSAVNSQKEYDRIIEQAEENQRKRRQKERDLEVKETALKKYKGQLFQIKTNREYEAMLEEIATTETDIGLLEEEILRLMEEGEALNVTTQEKKKQIDKEKEESQRVVAEKRKQIKALEEITNKTESQRPEILEKLERNIIVEYQKLLETRQGLAMVTASDGVCGGCYISMRPQMFEELKRQMFEELKRNEKIFHCPSCNRFLYWDHNR